MYWLFVTNLTTQILDKYLLFKLDHLPEVSIIACRRSTSASTYGLNVKNVVQRKTGKTVNLSYKNKSNLTKPFEQLSFLTCFATTIFQTWSRLYWSSVTIEVHDENTSAKCWVAERKHHTKNLHEGGCMEALQSKPRHHKNQVSTLMRIETPMLR